MKFPILPPPTGATRYAFDDEHDALVMFGGRVNDASVADTWVLTGAKWRRIETETAPEARNVYGMAYDAKRHRIVLYDGIGGEGRLDDLWEWDGATATWSRVNGGTQASANPISLRSKGGCRVEPGGS